MPINRNQTQKINLKPGLQNQLLQGERIYDKKDLGEVTQVQTFKILVGKWMDREEQLRSSSYKNVVPFPPKRLLSVSMEGYLSGTSQIDVHFPQF